MSSASKKWILVCHHHGEFPAIERDEVLAALPGEIRASGPEWVRIEGEATVEDRTRVDWGALQAEQAEQAAKRLVPLRNQGYRVAYFGRTLLPLAMDLGYRTESWIEPYAFLYHRVQHDWQWPGRPAIDQPPLVQVDYRTHVEPEEAGGGDAIVRVGVSTRIAPQDTLVHVPSPLVEVDVHLGSACGVDSLATGEELDRVAWQFAKALYEVRARYPGIERIHVFAAVPAGLAFRMGTLINPTVHPQIQTYQFMQSTTPRYHEALILGAPGKPVRREDEGVDILFLAAEPVNVRRIRGGAELREIRDRLRRGASAATIRLSDPHFAVRAKDIQDIFYDHRGHIVHFAGHGDHGGRLVLENEIGFAKPVQPAQIRDLVRLFNEDRRIRCVVLNACHTLPLAKALVASPSVVACAVGTRDEVDDDAAIWFADGFYNALARGEPLGRAFDLGKSQVGLNARRSSQRELFEIEKAEGTDLSSRLLDL